MNKKDPHDTFAALEAFHVTRLEWTYLDFDPPDTLEKVKRVQASGRPYGGGSSGQTGVPDGTTDEDELAVKKRYCLLDINGRPIVPDFKKHWKGIPASGCANNPLYRERFLAEYKRYIDAGADLMQRDEASGNHAVARTGSGCFCEYCMAGFRDYLGDRLTSDELAKVGITDIGGFDYAQYIRRNAIPTGEAGVDWSDEETLDLLARKARRGPLSEHFAQFQSESMLAFHRWVRKSIDEYAGRHVPMSCNNTSFQNWEEPYYREFDFGLSELMIRSADPVHIYERARKACSSGRIQVFGAPKTMGKQYDEAWLVHLRRRVIATSYAAGGLAAVPWDVFEQSTDGRGRYFGKPEEYADLFGFVRANHKYFEGYCAAGAYGPGIDDHRFGDVKPVGLVGTADRLFVFLRAVPRDPIAAVVAHLVDWSDGEAQPHTVRLRTECFFGGRPLSVTLRVPKRYAAPMHAEAERKAQSMRATGERLGPAQAVAYEALVDSHTLATIVDGDFTTIDLP
ncbi:MAG: hypothetical protein ACOY3P_18655, partial [Planctomycetota bacterium]